MRAIVLNDHVEVRDDWPTPNPAEGEVLVRVLRAGVCETDLQLIKGYMGFRGVLGHEFVGVVEQGEGWEGRRVVGDITLEKPNLVIHEGGVHGYLMREAAAYEECLRRTEAFLTSLHLLPSLPR